jgi:hypothetical protein
MRDLIQNTKTKNLIKKFFINKQTKIKNKNGRSFFFLKRKIFIFF